MRQRASGYDPVGLTGKYSVILYEYPFNERIRTYLRLEHLFLRLAELIRASLPLDHHFAMATIFEVMDVGARADLKSDVLKDLDKQKHILNGYRGNPAIAEGVLDEVIDQLDECFAALNGLHGKAGQSLTENDWLMSIRSRIGIPGGTCEFDLPAYFAWQHKPAAGTKSRSGALDFRARAPGRIDPPAAQTAARFRNPPENHGQCGASFSRTCPRAAPFNCCAWPRPGARPDP